MQFLSSNSEIMTKKLGGGIRSLLKTDTPRNQQSMNLSSIARLIESFVIKQVPLSDVDPFHLNLTQGNSREVNHKLVGKQLSKTGKDDIYEQVASIFDSSSSSNMGMVSKTSSLQKKIWSKFNNPKNYRSVKEMLAILMVQVSVLIMHIYITI